MQYDKIRNSYIGLLREEEENTWLFYPTSYSKPHFMNHTVHEIWTLIDKSSEEEIAQKLEKRYPNVSSECLLRDVKETVAYFVNLEMVMEVEHPMEEKQSKISMFAEKDFAIASKYMAEEKKQYSKKQILFFPEQYEGENFLNYYRAINMRTNHFHEVELYIKVVDEITEKLVGVLGIYICPNNQVVYITTLIFSDKSYLRGALEQLEQLLRGQAVNRIKVKFTGCNIVNKNEWENLGFQKESVIFQEGKNGCDFMIYGKQI